MMDHGTANALRLYKMGDKEASDLPEDLIIQEILTRLPVKSILRFKSVSKQWYSTLSSSDFANAHLIKSPFYHPSAPVNTLFLKSGKSYYLFSYDDDNDHISGSCNDNLVTLDVDFGYETEDNFRLTGCCNGLICLTQVPCKCFILWNPATRKFHKYESDEYLKHFEGQFSPCINSGFGYASSVSDYKYVRLSTIWGEESCIVGVHVFSLREKRWRKIDFDIQLFSLLGQPVLINETLYWAGYSIQARHVIVSFDLGIEKFDIFPYPSSDNDIYKIGKMGECLCKFVCDESMDIILKPPSVMKSVRVPNCLGLDMCSEMIGYTKTGKFFVKGLFTESGGEVLPWPPTYKMWLVDPGTEPMQNRMLLSCSGSFNIARYVPSLVSPFPTPT